MAFAGFRRSVRSFRIVPSDLQDNSTKRGFSFRLKRLLSTIRMVRIAFLSLIKSACFYQIPARAATALLFRKCSGSSGTNCIDPGRSEMLSLLPGEMVMTRPFIRGLPRAVAEARNASYSHDVPVASSALTRGESPLARDATLLPRGASRLKSVASLPSGGTSLAAGVALLPQSGASLFAGVASLSAGDPSLFPGDAPLWAGEPPLFVRDSPLFAGESSLAASDSSLFVRDSSLDSGKRHLGVENA